MYPTEVMKMSPQARPNYRTQRMRVEEDRTSLDIVLSENFTCNTNSGTNCHGMISLLTVPTTVARRPEF